MLTKRKYLFGTTVLAGVVALAAPAFAQDQLPGVTSTGAQDQEATEIGEIVVTGSRIRRDPTNAPTPLIQVQREDLLSTGQSTVIDYLATIPALSNSVVPSDTTGSGLGDGGLSLANLRSLGSNRTLTLVDGRRHVGSNGGSLAVDVDTIPRLLIENIEIVTGGASSVYGADAVSGVLNFVLRKDFEGLEIDANYGMINQGGEASKRISALIGHNFLDDRLNLYAHAEYEQQDPVTSFDIDWIENGNYLLGVDADPTSAAVGPNFDGVVDTQLFNSPLRMDRPLWGQTTVVHTTPFSRLDDPDVANFAGSSCIFTYAASCYAVAPGYTYWYDGTTARPANFGQRIGETGVSRPYNYGGDGVNPAAFSTLSRVPDSESQRYQAGLNFEISDNIEFFAEAKHIIEDTFDVSQPTFFDFDLDNTSYAPTTLNSVWGVQSMDLRWDDNAFLPALVRNAIATNVLMGCTAPTTTTDGDCSTPLGVLQLARHSMFGPDRTQDNERVLSRFVVGLRGSLDRLAFVDNVNWDIGYTYGEAEMENTERGVDSLRFALAADSVVDTAGVVNGTPGEIVCRAQLLDAMGLPTVFGGGIFGGEDITAMQGYGQAAIDQCVPLNIFGMGNQDEAALEYVDAAITVTELNEQEQFIASVAGELWDFWGAGPIGVALGVEHRREYTEGVGRDADTNGRFLFLNTGPDFVGAQYESDEAFAELSVPLFRDSWLGEYAELSGSYRYADYTTVGELDVYGVNLVYRPIEDIAFKTSFNTSVRVPDLGENFSPFSQTFANGFTDPCSTAVITGLTNAEIRNNRIANCGTLAAQQGLAFDFGGATVTTADDFLPNYTSGIAGVLGGNPFLKPEESESFTFSTVIQPRFMPNFSLVLDYYEIEINDVIASVSAQTAANNCVNGATLNQAACDTIFRNRGTAGEEFWVGGPVGDPIGGFIQGSINYASLTTRGLDFTARYSLDLEEAFGRNWGRLDYSLGGLWLIEQEQFLNSSDPEDGTELSSGLFYPRVRLTSSLTYSPNDIWSVNWTMDWQTSQDIVDYRDFINNRDSRPVEYTRTGDFARHDFTVRWNVRDDLSLRAGVVNAFDAEQAPWLGTTLYSNFDPYGTRYFIGLNYRPW